MSIESSRMLGVPQPSGREALTWSKALDTLTMALSISVSSSNSSWVMAKFSELIVYTFSTCEIVPRASSIGWLTSISTFSGLAPG